MLLQLSNPLRSQRRAVRIVAWLAVIGCVLVAVGYGGLAWLFREKAVSAASSPDGSWSVAVVARRAFLNNAHHVIVKVRDRDGNDAPINGAIEIGIGWDVEKMKSFYEVRFVDNQTALVGEERRIKKDICFPK